VIAKRRGIPAAACIAIAASCAACGGGTPLLHPAKTLPTGDLRLASGVSANVAVGGLADDLRRARDLAASDPATANTQSDYAKGALVSAAVAPGIAPFIAARVGAGNQFEGGLAYTGRAVRADMRRSFDIDRHWSLSLGLGGSAALYGRQQGTDLPDVDLAALHGFGADLPVLIGWESTGGLYMFWAGLRGGFEHDVVETLTSEPKSVTIGTPPIHLDATRGYGGGLLGIATGFRHVHVALELDVAYQVVTGTYNSNDVTVKGLTLSPATALWWSF
jgi:hypothetical protein